MQGRRILLTGASRGIGAEAVRLLTGLGAKMIGVARDGDKLKALEAKYPGFVGLVGDITDKTLGARLAKEVETRWGALDILVNNAAVQHWNEGFRVEPMDMLEEDMKINVLSAHWLTHTLLPVLKKGHEPRIINVTSGAGVLSALKADASMPAYRITKFALNGMTIMYANDLQGQVAINALDPGWLKTDLGGPQAPGEPYEGADRILELASMPFSVTGRIFHGKDELEF